MIMIILILIFGLGFCSGGLYELKQREKDNEEWCLLAQKVNDDWAKYCKTLIDEIKTLRPPCNIGDKVYWINHVTKEIETDIVISIHQYENGLSITTDTVGTKCTTTFSLNRFLEIMHFTKEEAEKALAERSGDNGK